MFWIILAVSNVFFCAARFHKNLRKLPEDDNFIQGDEYNIKGTDGIARTGSLFQPEVEPTASESDPPDEPEPEPEPEPDSEPDPEDPEELVPDVAP